MRIAFLVTGLEMGGAESQVVNLADRFAALGHSVLLISMSGSDAVVVLPQNYSVQLECLGMAKTLSGFYRAYRRAHDLVRAFAPDVLHSHMVHANVFARLLRLRTRVPRLICSAHNTNEGGTSRMWAYRLTDALADMTTNVSQEAVDCFIRRGAVLPRKIMTIHNGIDCERFRFDGVLRTSLRASLRLPEHVQVLLAVGRFCEAKDYPNLLNAFAALCAQHADCVLWIAGRGTQERLFEQAKTLGIDERVNFMGLRRDIPALMCAADIFVLSSAWEGLPLVVGEAMSCERVVVSTDAGGIREWLGNVGYVVPTRDSAALAAALLRSLGLSFAEKSAQGRAARERIVGHYSLTAVASRWFEVYQGNYATHG
jgi:glycosyltransferase involved in cell wall biosynthesis